MSCVKVSATKTANAAVIFIHGLGDSGHGWSWFPQIVRQTGLVKNCDEINYVFPNAPTISVTANGGMRMPGWFDIYEFGNPEAKQDVAGFFKTCEHITSFIKTQVDEYKIDPERIILGGFSQGSAISMAVLSLLEFKIGGLVALSGFCPVSQNILEKYETLSNKGANFDTPVFQGHGTDDPIIALKYGEHASDFYKNLGFKKWDFRSYAGVPHSTNDEELVDAIKFMANILNK
ncbi:hypothetical protein PUMCH_000652 [Australozyma saopauloensis]|uniref:Acyl-protein thioesterase 1 n=1 Tax=Australozyma saopauloensis TaxID=291208 RepID=A0AAX4H5Z6_9ASCO|nr:hypothetical protein PUMCH_000652 [[Candida] saopauloensis]